MLYLLSLSLVKVMNLDIQFLKFWYVTSPCLSVCLSLLNVFIQSYSIALLSERKYSHFRSVLDAYCSNLFKAATVHEYVCTIVIICLSIQLLMFLCWYGKVVPILWARARKSNSIQLLLWQLSNHDDKILIYDRQCRKMCLTNMIKLNLSYFIIA